MNLVPTSRLRPKPKLLKVKKVPNRLLKFRANTVVAKLKKNQANKIMVVSQLRDIKTDEYTLKSGHLDVGGGHKVYFEQWGNADAKTPVLMFHGGPGSNYKAKHKQSFDPKIHQLIFFDQRGAGNSVPYGRLENNTTKELLADATKIL